MYALLYRSRARTGLLASDLNAIIETAETRNRRLDVTGLLLYGQLETIADVPGEFVQWIEGPEGAVEALFAAVEADDRHVEVEVLGRGPIVELAKTPDRLFPTWSMGLVRLSELPATLTGFLRFADEWDRKTLRPAA